MCLYGGLLRNYGILPSEIDIQDAEEFASILNYAFGDDVNQNSFDESHFVSEGRIFYKIREG